MARTKWPQDLDAEKEERRNRVKESVNDPTKLKDELERERAKRKVGGWKYCKYKHRGYVRDDQKCDDCPDAINCKQVTLKKLTYAEYQLSKINGSPRAELPEWSEMRAEFGNNYDYYSIRIERLKDIVIDLANKIMADFNWNPELFYKVREINEITTKVLDALVPGWKEFRQQPQPMVPEHLLDILADVWSRTSDRIVEACGIQDIQPQEALEVLFGEQNLFGKRKKILKDLHNELGELCKQLEATFPVEFGRVKKEEDWPKSLKWMQKDKKIWAMMKRWEYFAPLLNIMKRKHRNHEDSQTLAERIGKGEGLILLPELNFESIAQELKISSDLVKKYVTALVKIGVLQMVQRPCPRQHAMYALGKWHEYKTKKGRGFKAVYFLKDSKEMREALAAFTPYGK